MPPALFTHFSIVSAARPRAVDLIGQLYINTYHYTSLYTPFVAGGLLGGAGDGAGAPAGGAARVPPDVGDKRHGLPDPVFISDIYVYIMIYINIQPRGQTPRPSRSGDIDKWMDGWMDIDIDMCRCLNSFKLDADSPGPRA